MHMYIFSNIIYTNIITFSTFCGEFEILLFLKHTYTSVGLQ